jgi:hypothetical protein
MSLRLAFCRCTGTHPLRPRGRRNRSVNDKWATRNRRKGDA